MWTVCRKAGGGVERAPHAGPSEISVPVSARPLSGPKTQDSVSSSMKWEAGLPNDGDNDDDGGYSWQPQLSMNTVCQGLR